MRFLNNSESGQINFVLKTKDYPGDTLSTASTKALTSTTQKKDMRARARSAVIRFESDDDATDLGNNDVGWRLGATRLEIRGDGRR